MVRNRFYLPGERRADGTIKLEEERPYKRADGRFVICQPMLTAVPQSRALRDV